MKLGQRDLCCVKELGSPSPLFLMIDYFSITVVIVMERDLEEIAVFYQLFFIENAL